MAVFKAYFDGGNQADSQQYKTLTLAGLSGNEIHWKNFEQQWGAALQRHDAKYLHTTDAVGLSEDFSKRQGWSTTAVNDLINDCAGVLERCCATIDENRNIKYPGLRPTTITVFLSDFIRALEKVPDLGTPEHLCATQGATHVLLYGIHIHGARNFLFFFDRNEPFCGHIRDRVNNKKSRRTGPGWQMVQGVSEADMKKVQALQAADLFAWCVNDQHNLGGTARLSWQRRVLAINRESEEYRYDKLIKPIHQNIEMVKTYKLPRRKPPR